MEGKHSVLPHEQSSYQLQKENKTREMCRAHYCSCILVSAVYRVSPSMNHLACVVVFLDWVKSDIHQKTGIKLYKELKRISVGIS